MVCFDAFRCIHKCHISNTQFSCGVEILLINCNSPMTSRLRMLHGVNNPYMVYLTSLQNFTIVVLVAYSNLYTFNTFSNIIIRTPHRNCYVQLRDTVRLYSTTYIVNVNVYKKELYKNTKHLLTPW